jgi:hypothetical protein
MPITEPTSLKAASGGSQSSSFHDSSTRSHAQGEKEIELELARKELENELLRKRIQLLDKAQEADGEQPQPADG